MATLPVALLLIYNLLILLGEVTSGKRKGSATPLLVLFFCSGMPALTYQIVWQRALFTIYGVNSESVAVVVSAFMIGLGLGSLLGGWLSSRFPRSGVFLFAIAELGTAVFGLMSLGIFHWAAEHTAGASLGYVIILSLGLLLVPTVCMGATLPLLTDFLVRRRGEVGSSVGVLYFANTFGSAVACYLSAVFLLRAFGQSGAVRLAALTNISVGLAALFLARSRGAQPLTTASPGSEVSSFISLRMAIILSFLTAFVSLGFEIVWFRVFVIASGSRAPAFALLLATFLAGIAAGAFISGKSSERESAPATAAGMSMALLVAGGVAPILLPMVAFLKWKGLNFLLACAAFFVVAALFGAVFPALCKLGISSGRTIGRDVSFIYVSNIAGSASGSLLIGFVLMDHLGMRSLAALLGALTIAIGGMVLFLAHAQTRSQTRLWLFLAVSVLASIVAQTLYSNFYRRLSFGPEADNAPPLAHLVENRGGTIAVLASGAVFGDSVYDGFFNTDPVHDKNGIVRAYAVGAFHPSPKRILMIGLSSGSWAQVLANHPDTRLLEIVEINSGYIGLIRQYPEVKSVLENPKVKIHIDDGRRWLLAHPEQRYDLIVQNTSFFWRDHVAELLSADYLQIVRAHLEPGGIFYYNTTGSDDVVATGLFIFPYGLRVLNFLAVSDTPISVQKDRWMKILYSYKIDGRPSFDIADKETQVFIEKYAKFSDSLAHDATPNGMENADSMRRRIKAPLIFTDDNMGWEWR